MEKIVIMGASDAALEVYNVLNDMGLREEIYFYEENASRLGESHGSSIIIDIKTLDKPIVAVQGVGRPHKKFIKRVSKYVTEWMKVIHPTARLCNDINIGIGAFIQQNVIVMPFAKLGNFTYLNVGALIGHHVEIGDYSHVGPYAKIMGRVTIGEECYVGVNSVILEKIKIADRVVIGAGAVVVNDIIEDGTVWVGVPAKNIEKRK